MRILALTDIHASYNIVEKILQREKCDVFVVGGDITNFGTTMEVKLNLEKWINSVKNIVAVTGNMDLIQHDELLDEIGISINGRGKIIDDVGFFGCSAAPISKLRTPYEIEEHEIKKILTNGYKQIQQATRKVLVSHAPPYGTKVDIVHSGYHVGSTAVREFIEENHVDVLICGHIHESIGKDIIKETKIINCGAASRGNYAIVEIDNGLSLKNLSLSL